MSAGEDGNDDEGVTLEPGLGFLPAVLVDQHFLARGRFGRLVVAVVELEEFDLGFGIDENTALVVDGEEVQAVGASGVVVVDGRSAVGNGRDAAGVRLHLLGAGDRYDLRSHRPLFAADKSPLASGAASVQAPEDVFARWSFLHVLHGLATSAQSELAIPVEGGRIVLKKTPEFAARSRSGVGVQETPAGLSLHGLVLDLRR